MARIMLGGLFAISVWRLLAAPLGVGYAVVPALLLFIGWWDAHVAHEHPLDRLPRHAFPLSFGPAASACGTAALRAVRRGTPLGRALAWNYGGTAAAQAHYEGALARHETARTRYRAWAHHRTPETVFAPEGVQLWRVLAGACGRWTLTVLAGDVDPVATANARAAAQRAHTERLLHQMLSHGCERGQALYTVIEEHDHQ
ncbi:hypothetical protein [Halosegnis marinus]